MQVMARMKRSSEAYSTYERKVQYCSRSRGGMRRVAYLSENREFGAQKRVAVRSQRLMFSKVWRGCQSRSFELMIHVFTSQACSYDSGYCVHDGEELDSRQLCRYNIASSCQLYQCCYYHPVVYLETLSLNTPRPIP